MSYKTREVETVKWPRTPFEKLEEWLFKQTRKDPFSIVPETVDEATRLREIVKKLPCPACKGNLDVGRFERGPKGWEADIECENCNFKAVISSLSAVLTGVNSLGKARER